MNVSGLENAINALAQQGHDQSALKALLTAGPTSLDLPEEIKQAILTLASRDGKFSADSIIKTISAGWA